MIWYWLSREIKIRKGETYAEGNESREMLRGFKGNEREGERSGDMPEEYGFKPQDGEASEEREMR